MRPAILLVLVALFTGTQGIMQCLMLRSESNHERGGYPSCEAEMCVVLSYDSYHGKHKSEYGYRANPVKACASKESQQEVIKGLGWETNKIQPFPQEIPVFNAKLGAEEWIVLKEMGGEKHEEGYVVNNTAVLYCFTEKCNTQGPEPTASASFYWIKVESMWAGVNLTTGTTCAWKPEPSDYPREWEGSPAVHKSRYCPGVKCCGVLVEEGRVAERFCPTSCRDDGGLKWICDATKPTNCTCANDGDLAQPPCDQGDTVDLASITVITTTTPTTTTPTTTTPTTTTATTTTTKKATKKHSPENTFGVS